jgi:nitrilase
MSDSAKAGETPIIIVLQMRFGLGVDQNIIELKCALQALLETRPMLVCLSEAFLVLSKSGIDTLAVAKRTE